MSENNLNQFDNAGFPVRIARNVRSKEDGPFGEWQEKPGIIELIYVASGTLRVSEQKRVIKVHQGEAMLVLEGAYYRLTSTEEEETVYVSIEFKPEIVVGKRNEYLALKYYNQPVSDDVLKCLPIRNDTLLGESTIDKIKDIIQINGSNKIGREILIKAYLCYLWAFFIDYIKESDGDIGAVKQASRDELRVRKALSYIHDNYKESITLNDISDKIYVGSNECLRCFKRVLGMSPVDYLIRFRIYRAARRLYKNPESVDTISTLALESGFNNVSYFNRAFKREFSCTPTEFLRLLKENDKGIKRTYEKIEKELTLQIGRYEYDRE